MLNIINLYKSIQELCTEAILNSKPIPLFPQFDLTIPQLESNKQEICHHRYLIGSEFFQPSTSYQRVGTSSNSSIPGSFPTEQESNSPPQPPSSRISPVFNSQTINSTFRNLSSWLNYLLIQPLIIIILVIFRILSTIINVIYFQNQSPSIVNGSGGGGSGSGIDGSTNNNGRCEFVDPVAKVSKFIRDLEDNLQPPLILQGNDINSGGGGSNDTHSPITLATRSYQNNSNDDNNDNINHDI